MKFDTAITARRLFEQVQASGELGDELDAAVEAEDRFSNDAGEEAAEAYRELVAMGERYPDADLFKEFLVYITWSHLMDETHPEHFRRGLAMSRDLIRRDAGANGDRLRHLQEMEGSFRAGLGQKSEDLMDFDADLPKSGD